MVNIHEDGAVKMATFAYFYGPVCSLLLCNASLFALIACRVRSLRRASAVLRRKDSDALPAPSALSHRRSALLYVKLLWLMGVAEMAVEVGAWAAHAGGFYYLMAADLIDLLRAASIFALCVCNRSTLRTLRERLRTLRAGSGEGGAGDRGGGEATRGAVELPESKGASARAEHRAPSSETVSSACRMDSAASGATA